MLATPIAPGSIRLLPFHLHNDLFSQLVVSPDISETEVNSILQAKTEFEDILTVMNDQKSITGEIRFLVMADELARLNSAINKSS